ncbi:MAG TPA: hypothetical protein VKD70_18900 [Candidatus Acidoferrum sp.]|nr:hypothetical protein [Candidatus Acidoferrum sp.]
MSDIENYEKLLADAEQERARVAEELAGIDLMIAFLKKRLGRPDTPSVGPKVSIVPDYDVLSGVDFRKAETAVHLRPDAFFKMNVPDAIREYLNITKRPRSARQITDALESGGLTHRAKNLYQTVFPTLQRMQASGLVEKLGNGDWGLAEWYKSGRRAEEAKE